MLLYFTVKIEDSQLQLRVLFFFSFYSHLLLENKVRESWSLSVLLQYFFFMIRTSFHQAHLLSDTHTHGFYKCNSNKPFWTLHLLTLHRLLGLHINSPQIPPTLSGLLEGSNWAIDLSGKSAGYHKTTSIIYTDTLISSDSTKSTYL